MRNIMQEVEAMMMAEAIRLSLVDSGEAEESDEESEDEDDPISQAFGADSGPDNNNTPDNDAQQHAPTP